MKLGHKLGRKGKARSIAAVGGSVAATLVSLLGGLALVLFALRDVDVRVKLTRRAREQGQRRA